MTGSRSRSRSCFADDARVSADASAPEPERSPIEEQAINGCIAGSRAPRPIRARSAPGCDMPRSGSGLADLDQATVVGCPTHESPLHATCETRHEPCIFSGQQKCKLLGVLFRQ
eukprot:scaffold172254_cov31-Tisochrysis_lutea.AAC.1